MRQWCNVAPLVNRSCLGYVPLLSRMAYMCAIISWATLSRIAFSLSKQTNLLISSDSWTFSVISLVSKGTIGTALMSLGMQVINMPIGSTTAGEHHQGFRIGSTLPALQVMQSPVLISITYACTLAAVADEVSFSQAKHWLQSLENLE